MKLKKWEWIALCLLVGGLCLWAFFPKSQGAMVSVAVDGDEVCSLPLSRDGQYPISGYGGFSLTLVIQEGRAYVVEATCPDLICQNHSPISKSGQQIVCLPGRIMITVSGGEDAVDASTG